MENREWGNNALPGIVRAIAFMIAFWIIACLLVWAVVL
jgi:hypothetical protein